jgi:1,4-alpha-glucan branching enzyme
VGNLGTVQTTDQPHQGQPHSVELTLPPLGVLWLAPEHGTPADVPVEDMAAASPDVHVDEVTEDQTEDPTRSTT